MMLLTGLSIIDRGSAIPDQRINLARLLIGIQASETTKRQNDIHG